MSTGRSSGQLLDHLQSLLGQSRRTTSETVWTDLLQTWQATGTPITAENDDPVEVEFDIPVGIPLPTLLDYYNPPAGGARLDDPAGHAIAFRPGSGAGGRGDYEDQGLSGPDAEAAELTARLQNHIASEPSFRSLLDLLSSTNTAEELQDDLMGILGWEGSSFDLVAELFSPGMREGVLKHGQGDALRAEAGVFVPNSRAPLPLELSSTNNSNGNGNGDGTRAAPRTHQEGLSFIEAQLEQNANRPLFSNTAAIPEQIQYPNVYTSTSGTAMTSYGGRLALPMGTIRKEKEHSEEVVIPPANPVPPKTSERLINITELGPMAAGCFPGYQTLNRIQSIVQPVAMKTNENMLICAPTGAGKTDVAVMSILRVLSQNVRSEKLPYGPNSIRKDDFKIIYVAPMKALAAEITRKIGKRLAWLGIQVRELTGDMQLTRKEIGETQIIVTTPEKWDVVTRKPTGEGELASKVKLLIIDEVHLLNEERGAVIETIVARTLRLVESSQSLIRIVGLSATLPNYIDVSDFLRVNRYQGLFFFDASFRPVPLEQHFIGVRGKVRSETSKRNMDQAVFDKVAENLAAGHQVMVFVHARKETVKTAERLKEMAQMEGNPEDFDPRSHPQFDFFRREVGLSRNKEMKQLFDYGFGIHHAGMLRSDRNMMERMFEANCIKVLCCTSTLAWGVNLPAHAVVIKGTQVYDAGKGSFVDLSILDVLQIFGRAGRPGYETSGVGYICTTQDKLDHYLDAVLSQHPIESKLVPGIIDSMNAEVSLGTISNVSESIEWLGYTYLFVRMKRNPFLYGMPHDEVAEDPQLGSKREGLTRTAGRRLAEIGMIRFDEVENTLTITDLGRIAAKYYLKHETVEIFNQHFKAKMTEADTLALLSMSTEFHQLQVRENEIPELQALMKDVIPCQVKGGTDTTQGKVNILLQAYICRAHIEDFALVSDTAYVAQNAGRIIRALLEIALARKWGNAASVLASMSKSIEKQMWSYQNPLRQSKLQYMVLHNLETHADDYAPAELCEMTPMQAGELIKMNDKHGASIVSVAKQFPTIGIACDLRPLSHDLLQISVRLSRNFQWSQALHGFSEPFWVWIEDSSTSAIFQYQMVHFKPSTTLSRMEFVVPIRTTNPPAYVIRVISDRWVGSEEEVEVSLAELAMPAEPEPPTPLLSVPYLSLQKVLKPLDFGTGYADRFSSYNNIQSQVFWPLFNTDESILLAAPNGSGKSTISDAATWRTLRKKRNSRVVYLSPNRHFAADMLARLKELALSGTHLQILRLDTISNFEHHKHNAPCIGVATPIDLLVHIGGDPHFLEDLDLIVMDDLHLLDEAYEMVILRIMLSISYSTTRLVGLSSSLQDAHSLADWLQIASTGIYTFRPTDRAIPLINHIQPYSIPQSAILLKSMVKPTYAAVKAGLPRSTIIFVPSRMVCKTVANDLVTQSGMMLDINGFLAAPRQDLEPNVKRMRDSTLIEPLLHGIGVYHEGMHYQDLTITLSLFAAEIVRVLIVPRESCWTLPVHAGNVVVMGAQYLELETSLIPGEPPERRLRNYTLNELIRMQGFATWPSVSGSLVDTGSSSTEHGARFTLMCQSEQKDTYQRFLDEGLPLESKLSSVLSHSADRQIQATLTEMLGEEPKKQDLMDLVSWSYLWIRMRRNPNYYDILDEDLARRSLSRMVDAYTDEVYKKRRRAAGRQGLIDQLPTVGGGEGKTNGKTPNKGGKGKNKASPESSEDNTTQPDQGGGETGQGVDARIEDSGEEEDDESDVDKYARGFKTGPGADDLDDSDGDEAGDEMTERE